MEMEKRIYMLGVYGCARVYKCFTFVVFLFVIIFNIMHEFVCSKKFMCHVPSTLLIEFEYS